MKTFDNAGCEDEVTIAVFSPFSEIDSALSQAVGMQRLSIRVRTLAELTMKLRTRDCAAVLFPVDDQSDSVLPAISLVHEHFPLVPTIGAIQWPNDVPSLIRVVRAGLDDLIVLPDGNLEETIARATETRVQVSASEYAIDLAVRVVPDATKPIVEAAIRLAPRAPAVVDLAFALGLSKRTLSRRLARAMLPQAGDLLAWARCLVAAVLLETGRTTVDAVARNLRFPSTVALRKTLRRVTGLRPTQIRDALGAQGVAEVLVRGLGPRLGRCDSRIGEPERDGLRIA